MCLFAASPGQGRPREDLIAAINAYRASPGSTCGAQPADGAPPLEAHPALAALAVGPGVFLDQVLERAGFPVAHAEAISVSGARDAPAALAAIIGKHCSTLLSPQYGAAGVTRSGENWLIVLAQPMPPPVIGVLPDPLTAGPIILAAVNAARAAPRTCGTNQFGAAPPLAWNAMLALAAQTHSSDMAEQRYFSHVAKDGRAVAQRATQAGYRWRLVGENIAVGQDTAEQAVAGWLDSPGHCANIMNPRFTEMGAAFDIAGGARPGRAYWTQVLATPP